MSSENQSERDRIKEEPLAVTQAPSATIIKTVADRRQSAQPKIKLRISHHPCRSSRLVGLDFSCRNPYPPNVPPNCKLIEEPFDYATRASQYCHRQVNQFAQYSLSHREQSVLACKSLLSRSKDKIQQNESQTHLPLLKDSMRLKTEGADPSDKLSRKYHIRQRKSLNPELLQNLKELNKLGLSVQSPLKNVRYAGHIKIPTVHNDYHTSKTNAGYSRNKLGGIYPK